MARAEEGQDLLKAKDKIIGFCGKKKLLSQATILDFYSTKASVVFVSFSLEYLLAYRYVADRFSIFKYTQKFLS